MEDNPLIDLLYTTVVKESSGIHRAIAGYWDPFNLMPNTIYTAPTAMATITTQQINDYPV